MKFINNPERSTWAEIVQRPAYDYSGMEETVKTVFREVRSKGDAAVSHFTRLFDGIDLKDAKVTEKERTTAASLVPDKLKNAIILAKSNIEKFHSAQKTAKIEVETTPGVWCWQEKRPIQKIGLYIPGGSAPLFSTVLMLAIPAQLAGCREIVLCTPPDQNGEINPAVLFAAGLCGISQVFKIGGIQAIAAMTFGTETVPKAYKIFGPGNQFVTAAKMHATQFGAAIDMPAGPSELLVFADDSAQAAFVAADLLSQAEHGPDSQVILVSTSRNMIDAVEAEIQKQIDILPRAAVAQKAMANSKLIWVETAAMALDLINEYAPEHFIICAENEGFFIEGIQNAGSVFIGNYTPESAGDYASGTNHTLPTNGFAKNYGGINLDSFLRPVSFQKITEEGLLNIGETIETMAAAEGLQAHKNAVSIRLQTLNQ